MSDTPEHYSTGGISPWDYCAAKFPGSFDDHLLISAIEYISRAKHKAGAADIRKAYDNLGHWLKRNEPGLDQADGAREPAVDDGKRYRVEYLSQFDGWSVLSRDLCRKLAENCLSKAVASQTRREYRIVEDTREPVDDGKVRVETYDEKHGWQWWSDWIDRSQVRVEMRRANQHGYSATRVIDRKPEGGAA